MTSYICYDDVARLIKLGSDVYGNCPPCDKMLEALDCLPAIHTEPGVSKLKIIRSIKGKTVHALSKETGLAMATISLYENGLRDARRGTLEILANGLGVPVQMIMEENA